MPTKCAIVQCKNVKNKNSRISFFQFPLNEPKLLSAWIAAVNRKDWTPTTSSRICGKHFKCTDFYNTPGVKVNKLKPDTIPSKNLPKDTPQKLNSVTDKSDLYTSTSQGIFSDLSNELSSVKDSQSSRNMFVNKETGDVKYDKVTMGAQFADSQSPTNIFIKEEPDDVRDTNIEMKLLINLDIKRNAVDILKPSTSEYRKLEEENKALKKLIDTLKDNHSKEMETQAEMFRFLIANEKETYKKQVLSLKTEVKLWKRKVQRKEVKINKLLLELKNKSFMDKE
ncbi:uncharacterized protein LOC143187040 [Calliopsis andreniformis]|uniref:uncharacterized protein LOC143187040 n=1 Tax=Calliopsis andreniformis TaxID=337506 RepID=UPI003FCE8671